MVWVWLVKTSQNSPLKITFFQVRVEIEIMPERSSCCPGGNDDYVFVCVEECYHHATGRRSWEEDVIFPAKRFKLSKQTRNSDMKDLLQNELCSLFF